MEHGGVAYYWTLPVAGVVCLVFGFLFGLPALRLEGIYLALATFALAIAMPQILKSTPLEHWTGGVQGIVLSKPDAPFGLPTELRPVALDFHRRRRARDVRVRLSADQEPHRPRHDGDPRQSDRGESHGHRSRRSTSR